MNLIGILIALTILVLFVIGLGILFKWIASQWSIPQPVMAIIGIIAAMILLVVIWQIFSGGIALPGMGLGAIVLGLT